MRRALRTRSVKKTRRNTPGGVNKVQLKRKRTSHHICKCGAKLNRARLGRFDIRKVPHTQRRAERPFANLCSGCMRNEIWRTI